MRVKGIVVSCVLGGLAACTGGEGIQQGSTRQAVTQPAPSPHPGAQAKTGYTLFETLQVRPLALSSNGKLLFAVNTPDNRLEILSVDKDGLELKSSVSVGLEPVAVAVRNEHEVWVVNHLSDSVSVVRVGEGGSASVTRTLLVGDEPRDIVFGGADHARAFITTAHRGQNSPDDPGLFDPTTGRADVWVFDADHLGTSAGGDRLTKITLFADTPRALAVSADGSRVYAAPFFSGNQTTLASKDAVRHVYANLVDPNNPNVIRFFGVPQPITSLVVKYKPGLDGHNHWFDAMGTNFDAWIKVSLPDLDVFAIDAAASPPVAIAGAAYPHAGTTLFNMAVNPVNGKVYVSNTDAHNDVRFEGNNPGLPFSSVRGNIVDSRITVLDPASGAMVYNNLNSHVVGGVGDASLSRAFPQDMAVSSDGKTVAVVAQGSAKLAIYDTAALESGTAAPTAANQVLLSAGGPTGVVLDKKNRRAFVLTRFDNGISTVDLDARAETSHVKLLNPEPARITGGRRFLYDATFTSANGTQACASCHIGGDFDGLSWDLGNPGASPLPITKNAVLETVIFTFSPTVLKAIIPQLAAALTQLFAAYQPLKGPMTTQSLRGMDNHGSMHWRGDRNGAIQQNGQPFIDPVTGVPVVSAQPNSGIFNEEEAFESFNVAFPGLVGRAAQLSVADMDAFRAFALEITYPPNPIRNLDNSLTPIQQQGSNIYHQHAPNNVELPVDRLHNCNGCHVLDPNGNAGATEHPGFFGSDGRLSFENLPQIFKVAHFRNAYQKVGMFASSPDENRVATLFPQLNPPLAAVRGFGYQPDGAVGSIEQHLSGRVFIRVPVGTPAYLAGSPVPPNPYGIPFFFFDAQGNPTGIDPAGFPVRRALANFLLAYDSNMKPIVGQQVTLTEDNGVAAAARIDLLEARAAAGDCDLVVKGRIHGREAGFVWDNGTFISDDSRQAPLSDAALRALVGERAESLTFTAVPLNSGWRIGVDRDGDGDLDGDERGDDDHGHHDGP